MSSRNRAQYRRDSKQNPEARKIPARKNTRKWCKGVVGREHTLAIRPHDPKYRPDDVCHFWKIKVRGNTESRYRWWICTEQEYCTTCGKVLRHSLGRDCTCITDAERKQAQMVW